MDNYDDLEVIYESPMAPTIVYVARDRKYNEVKNNLIVFF